MGVHSRGTRLADLDKPLRGAIRPQRERPHWTAAESGIEHGAVRAKGGTCVSMMHRAGTRVKVNVTGACVLWAAVCHRRLSNHDPNMPTSMAKSMLDRVPIR